MRTITALFIMCSAIAPVKAEDCGVISKSGQVEIRQPYQEEWIKAKIGERLKDRITIRTQDKSRVEIRTYDGSIFRLPPNAQIEIRNLRKLDRNGVIMELTILDLQKLPSRTTPDNASTALVLHGSIDEDSSDDKDTEKYISMEINGAMALFNQGYISGFIIKWNQLKTAFPNVKSEAAEKAIEEAYRMMDMRKRLKDIRSKKNPENMIDRLKK